MNEVRESTVCRFAWPTLRKRDSETCQNLEFFMSVKYYIMSTLVGNHSNSRFWYIACSAIFVLLKLICLVILFEHKFQIFLAKIDHFFAFHSKCKRSSLRLRCWMRRFLWFLNTVSSSTTHVTSLSSCFLVVN